MIDLQTYLLFICAVFVLVVTPGPDMALILARTVAQGRKAGVFAAVGINAGAYVHVAASVAGLTAVLASSPFAFAVVKWAGAATAMLRRNGNTVAWLNKAAGAVFIGLGLRLFSDKL